MRSAFRDVVGQQLAPSDIERIVDCYVRQMRDRPLQAANPTTRRLANSYSSHLTRPIDLLAQAAITFSGGVGQLIYDQRRGGPPPAITQFGDLGGELAARMLQTLVAAGRAAARGLEPEGLGRATVYGLLRHRTELSGATSIPAAARAAAA